MVEKAVPDPDFESLLRYIQESRGLDFRGYKRTSLRRRISLRMEAVGTTDFGTYQSYLEVHPGEFEDLLNTVLINVTSFFRDADAWEVLRTKVVPLILADAGAERTIRVWSVGCASGEEPYSIAMLFAEALGIQAFCERVKIYATDLDEEALRNARQATYSPREVEGVPPDLLDRYFERTNHHYVFHRDIRKCVIFGRHNVVKDAPIGRIDLLVCRNLLIYLEADTQDVVLPRLHYALAPDGYLFLGKAETQLARSALFQPEDMKHRIFAKVPQEWRRGNPANALAATREQRPETPLPHARLLESVLNETATAYLVVDGTGVVTLANHAARHLLNVGEGDIGRPFQDLPISYRPLELRVPIEEVMDKRWVKRLDHQEYHQNHKDPIRLTIEIRPLLRGDGTVQAALLAFTDTTRIHAMQRELETAQESLSQSVEELQSANEELETTNEELQSTNEELETTNEELQSTNEELETINEEARSSNEEMEAANEELRLQAQQAVSYKFHLESVLRSMNIGVVVIDDQNLVQSWNRWSENVWGLRTEEAVGTALDALDIGFPVDRLAESIVAVRTRRDASAEQVLEGVDRRGRAILCRVRIVLLAADDRDADGVVIAFEDVTEERRREDRVRHLGRVMARALNEIYFVDPETLRFTLLNRGAERKLGQAAAEHTRMTLADVLPLTDAEELRRLLAPLIAGEKTEIVFETVVRSGNGHDHPAELCLQYFGDETPPILVTTVHDISGRRPLPSA